ncbi:MAG: HAD family hydrolase [Oscillospiraceae bacterium]|jgi:phosphoglycolate phosphatase|nr:HAD family hydrolase [Oscillospiraceae bacterium]
MGSYNAYLFDFDYTLADATEGIVAAVNYALFSLGFPAQERETLRRMVSIDLAETFRRITGSDDEELIAALQARHIEEASRSMAAHAALLPGAEEALRTLSARGAKLAVVTNRRRRLLKEMLEAFEIAEFFDYIVAIEDVLEPKPAPEGILAAISALGSAREDALYAGDTLIDAESAARAGVDFAAVMTGTTGAKEFEGFPYVKLCAQIAEITAL